MADPITLSIAAIGVAAGGQVASFAIQEKAAQKSEKLQKRANQTQEASGQVELAKRRARAIAQQRIIQANNLAASASEGTTSSAASGVNSSLASSTGSQIASANSQFFSAQSTFALRNKAQRIESSAARKGSAIEAFSGIGSQALTAFAKP